MRREDPLTGRRLPWRSLEQAPRLAATVGVAALAATTGVGCTRQAADKASPAVSASAQVALGKQVDQLPDERLKKGDRVPDVEALAHTGQRTGPRDFRGVPLGVYFCASHEHEASACRRLAQGLRDGWFPLSPRRTMVLGATRTPRQVSREIAAEERLPFLLLADAKAHVARAFGAVLPGQGYPRDPVFFTIGPDGKIDEVLVDPKPSEAIAALERVPLSPP